MPNILRPLKVFGQKGKISVGQTKFYADYVEHEGDDPYVPGTKIRRLRRIKLGPRAVGFLESEVDAFIEALAALRDVAE
jgi:hypothetical protein